MSFLFLCLGLCRGRVTSLKAALPDEIYLFAYYASRERTQFGVPRNQLLPSLALN